jgi:CheY-like chemotaxis protein
VSTPIRVLVADDQALLRGSFRVLLETSGMDVVGEACTGVEAVDLTERERPDVVLMDVRMPEMDGIEATRRICRSPAAAGTRILILTMFNLDAYVPKWGPGGGAHGVDPADQAGPPRHRPRTDDGPEHRPDCRQHPRQPVRSLQVGVHLANQHWRLPVVRRSGP